MCSGKIETTLDAACILASKAVEYAIVDAVKNADTVGKYISFRDLEQPIPINDIQALLNE